MIRPKSWSKGVGLDQYHLLEPEGVVHSSQPKRPNPEPPTMPETMLALLQASCPNHLDSVQD
jgi:hypothetical protein